MNWVQSSDHNFTTTKTAKRNCNWNLARKFLRISSSFGSHFIGKQQSENDLNASKAFYFKEIVDCGKFDIVTRCMKPKRTFFEFLKQFDEGSRSSVVRWIASASSKQTGLIENDDMIPGNKMKESKIERNDSNNSMNETDMVSMMR